MIDGRTEGQVGERAVSIAKGKRHLAIPDQRLAVELRTRSKLHDGNARADKVVVLVFAVVFVPSHPAAFGFELEPVREVKVHVGSNAYELISSFTRLEDGCRASRGDGELADIG